MGFCKNPCPDCNGPAIDFGYGAGNGECSECHGYGGGGALDSITASFTGEESKCRNCGGSGKCPTCNGKGEIDD